MRGKTSIIIAGILVVLIALPLALGVWVNMRPFRLDEDEFFFPGLDPSLDLKSFAQEAVPFGIPSVLNTLWLAGASPSRQGVDFLLKDLRNDHFIGTLHGLFPVATAPEDDRILVEWNDNDKLGGNPLNSWLPRSWRIKEQVIHRLLTVTISTGATHELTKYYSTGNYGLLNPFSSPTGRFCLCEVNDHVLLLFDLKSEQLIALPKDYVSYATWWSGHELAYLNQYREWVVYDLETQAQRILFTWDQMVSLFTSQGVTWDKTLRPDELQSAMRADGTFVIAIKKWIPHPSAVPEDTLDVMPESPMAINPGSLMGLGGLGGLGKYIFLILSIDSKTLLTHSLVTTESNGFGKFNQDFTYRVGNYRDGEDYVIRLTDLRTSTSQTLSRNGNNYAFEGPSFTSNALIMREQGELFVLDPQTNTKMRVFPEAL